MCDYISKELMLLLPAEFMGVNACTQGHTHSHCFNIAKYFCFKGGIIKPLMVSLALSYFATSLASH